MGSPRDHVRRLEKHWYESGASAFEAHAAPVTIKFTTTLIRRAAIETGCSGLDLACGGGASTLSAAEEVGEEGMVVGADVVTSMLRILRTKARESALKNIVLVNADAESLPFPNGRFDFVICQFGLMHFVDRRAALGEVYRVLRPDGRICVSVWSEPERAQALGLFARVLKKYASSAMPEGTPSWFDLGPPGVLDELLREMGFVNVGSEREVHYQTYESEGAYWEYLAEGGRGKWVLSQLPTEVVEKMRIEITDAASRYRSGDDGLRFMMEAVYAYGSKSVPPR